MAKYADDTYLVIPASNIQTCAAEISNVSDWATVNNLSLNRAKSAEIVFVAPRSRRETVIPPAAVPGFKRVDSLKVLGVTISRRFSVTGHVDHLLAACAQTLFALRTLQRHGLPTTALHTVFQATVVAKLAYASPAWWGYTNAADRRLESFLRRSVQFDHRAASAPTLATICAAADDKLFRNIISNTQHLLHSLLPPPRDDHYELRNRTCHNLILPARTSAVKNCNLNNQDVIQRLELQLPQPINISSTRQLLIFYFYFYFNELSFLTF